MPINRAFNGYVPGDMKLWHATAAPAGWLKANGAAVSRTAYPGLFAAIGTTYGAGDGSTTFNLPDWRGEFVRGLDDGRGVDSGRTVGTAQAAAFAAHTHVMTLAGDHGSGATTGIQITGVGSDEGASSSYIANTGGTETRPRNMAALWCIKF